MKLYLWILLSSETLSFSNMGVTGFGASYTSWLKTASYLETGNLENKAHSNYSALDN